MFHYAVRGARSRAFREGGRVVSGGVGVRGSGSRGAGAVRGEAASRADGAGSAGARPWLFIGLVFALSVPFVALGFAADAIPGLPNGLPMSALMFVCPGIAATILVRREAGPGAVKALWRKVFRLDAPRGLGWLAVAVGVPAAMMAFAYAGLRLTGAAVPLGDAPWAGVPVFFVLYFAAAAGEEAGWTAYATGALCLRYGRLGAALVLGIVWGVWHLVPLMQAGHSFAWIAWWFLSTIALRLAMVRLYLVSGGSVLAAIVAHDAANIVFSLFPEYAKTPVMAALALAQAVVAAVLWLVTVHADSGAFPVRGISP